ncbi:MAG: glycosyltransferase [Verrucomicrobia bacterium]|nr:glycosyltransferase [Verrucomicrobiota bacterium]
MNTLHEWIEAGLNVAMMATFALSSIYMVFTVLALLLRRKVAAQPPPMTENLPTVTVQIPTYNELAALNCAANCLAFDYPREKLQILIGDDSNDIGISAQIDAFAAKNPFVRVCRRGKNIGFKPGNLNHMLHQTTGDYILILDSDFLPEPGFLRRIVQPVIENPALAGVQSTWRISNTHQNHTTLMGAGIINVIHVVILPLIKRFANTGVFCGSGELVRKDLLIQNGGWTLGALTEDVDYSLRIIASGHRIAYLDDLHIACEVPYAPRDLCRQQMRWAYGVMRAFMNHGFKMIRSKLTGVRTKLAAICFGGGYIMVSCLLFTMVLGFLNFASGWGLQTTELPETALQTAGNILFTCGMLISSLCASFIAGASLRSLGKLIVASLTLGVVLIFFVGKGIFKALFGLSMHWFMVRKNGNALVPVA